MAAADEVRSIPAHARHRHRSQVTEALAINEVSLLRQTAQAAKIRIIIDDRVRMEELIADGALVATFAASTAYNLSVHGPIIPLGADILALTPISPFRPRRWRGALLPAGAQIGFEILAPTNAWSAPSPIAPRCAMWRVDIHQDDAISLRLLHDPDHNLEERILMEHRPEPPARGDGGLARRPPRCPSPPFEPVAGALGTMIGEFDTPGIGHTSRPPAWIMCFSTLNTGLWARRFETLVGLFPGRRPTGDGATAVKIRPSYLPAPRRRRGPVDADGGERRGSRRSGG